MIWIRQEQLSSLWSTYEHRQECQILGYSGFAIWPYIKQEPNATKFYFYQRRDNLSRLKQARDALRFDNQNIHQNGGLLGNKALLRDFEDRKDETDELKQKLSQMRMRYAELTLNLNAVRKKIEESKSR